MTIIIIITAGLLPKMPRRTVLSHRHSPTSYDEQQKQQLQLVTMADGVNLVGLIWMLMLIYKCVQASNLNTTLVISVTRLVNIVTRLVNLVIISVSIQ